MKKDVLPIVIALLFFSFVGHAQNSRETVKDEKVSADAVRYATHSTNQKKYRKKSKKSDHSYLGVFDQKIKEFEIRMETAAKEKKLAEKEMRKPQYSDPSYFGHKRKPKKRPPGKKKFCKECGLYH